MLYKSLLNLGKAFEGAMLTRAQLVVQASLFSEVLLYSAIEIYIYIYPPHFAVNEHPTLTKTNHPCYRSYLV